MFERFTDRARKVMALANQEAQRFNHQYIGTEHFLLGLIKEGSGVGANILINSGIDLHRVRIEVEKLVKSGPDMVTMGKLPQTPRAKKVIEYGIEEARTLNHNYFGTEHLLLGLLREHDGVAAQVLINMGLKLEDIREEVLNLLGSGSETVPAASPAPVEDITPFVPPKVSVTFGTVPAGTPTPPYMEQQFDVAERSLRDLIAALTPTASVEVLKLAMSLLEALGEVRQASTPENDCPDVT